MTNASPANNGEGRRRVPRRAFEAPIGLLIAGEYGMSRCHQVGEGGMMVSSARALAVGQRVSLSFFVPGGSVALVRAVVRSLIPVKDKGQGPRYGLEFENLDFQARREIRNFVAAATRMDGQLLDQKYY